MTPKELVEAIKAARDAGMPDIEEELKEQLRALRNTSPEPVEPPAPRSARELGSHIVEGSPQTMEPPALPGGSWIGLSEGDTPVPAGDDIPKRSKREIAKVNAYFNEAEQQLAQDYEELNDTFDGLEYAPEREDK